MSTYTSRYVRTANHRRRRLTLHHAARYHEARHLATEYLTARELVNAWHISGPFGERPCGVGAYPRCLSRRLRARQDAEWERLNAEWDARQREQDRKHRVIAYFEFRPFANGSEYDWWTARNCEGCARYNPESTAPDEGCPLEYHLSLGEIDNSTAGRIWGPGPYGVAGACQEREANNHA